IELSYEKKLNCQNNCPLVAYVKINQFGDNTNDEWDNIVNELQKKWRQKEIKGLIVDVRDNPGGYLESAVYIASDFLPYNSLIVKQESTTSFNHEYKVTHAPRLENIPLVILINKGSASASEILAGALRDHKKATIIGEKSFGKGSVQEALDLKEGAGLHVTVAKWILPKGDWINSKGIKPEIEVVNNITEGNTLTRENDLQLEKAIEFLIK
ncbi:MAG: S41 family peptidase, partial [Microgenomates group bacterium]